MLHNNNSDWGQLIAIPQKNAISIVIPAYNEVNELKQNIQSINEAIKAITKSYQIIITEDGTTDGTDILAKELAEKNPYIYHVHSNRRLGKGLALKNALRFSKGEFIVYMDADLSTSLDCLNGILEEVKNGYDVAIGSRNKKGAYVKRPLLRRITSISFNLVTKFLFGDGVYDHQCGFKAFKAQILEFLVNQIESNGFLFDTELIVKAKRKGLTIAEVPIMWKEPDGRESKFQLFRDGINILLELFKLRIKLWKQ